jgi:XTP/dITP diphosphohydrolase
VSRLLVATTNPGKQREFRRLLAALEVEVLTPDQLGLDLDVEEPHDAYVENAVAKSMAFARATGLISLADDSGIEVAALGWGPGVLSARWAGEKGREAVRMLEALAGVEDRRARMVCALAVAVPGPDEPSVEVFTGVMEGAVAPERRGTGGFGYDPVFLVEDRGMTTAELPEGEKDRLSHRGRAVAAALPRLRQLLPAE